MKKSLLTVLLFICLGLTMSFGQLNKSIIAGKVISQESGLPVADVNVYLSQTTLGASTDKNGIFAIDEIPNGIYNLVFSFVGFRSEVKRIKLFKADSLYFEVVLVPVKMEMKSIVVTGKRDQEWLENLELFKREFIGTSENAEKTVLVNPEVLDFKWNDQKKTFTASAPKKLHLINHALGYEVFIDLVKFVYKPSTNKYRDKVVYLTYPRYKEMKSEDSNQRKQWFENRKDTYEGSLRHFMHALYSNAAWSENFDVKNGSIDKIDRKQKDYLLRFKLLSDEYKKRLKAFEYSIYRNSDNPGLAIHYGSDDPSFFFPVEQNIFFIDEYGNILNIESIFVGGGWHADRMADALPLNYAPADCLKNSY